MKLTKSSAFILGYYICLVVWWLAISYFKEKTEPINLIFAFSYGLIPLVGGLMGILGSKKWGMLHSAMGKALFFISLGLFSWGIGEAIWSYYNIILHVAVPYPSWADAAFIISWPLWGIGMIYLSLATGAKYELRRKMGRFILILFPLLIIAFSYYFLVTIARSGSLTTGGGPVKVFFDLAYPVGDVVILTLSLLIYGLSFRLLGGKFKWTITVLLLGFIFNYFADFGFSYTTTVNSFYNGSYVDLLFTTAMALLSFGVNNFDTKT